MMNGMTMCLTVLFLLQLSMPISGYPQSHRTDEAISIRTLADLKSAVYSPLFRSVLMDMNSWLPILVSSLHWETRMSQHFLLLYHIDASGEDDALFETFLDESESMYSQVKDFFRIEARTKQDSLMLKTRLICIVVKTNSRRTFGSLADPHHLFYFLDTNHDPKYMEKFRHEYAHWIWGRMYGEAPSLFNEGIAVYAERMSAPVSMIDNFLNVSLTIDAVAPLSEIAFNENFWKHKNMYTVGGLFIHYLVEQYGWQPLKQFFLLSEYEDENVLEHFKQAYGMDLAEADQKWRLFIKSKLPLIKSHKLK